MALDFGRSGIKPELGALSPENTAAPGLWRGCALLHDLRSATVARDVSRARRDGEIFGAPATTPAGLEFFNATRSQIVTDVADDAAAQNTIAIRVRVDDPSRLQWIHGRHADVSNAQGLWVSSTDLRIGSWSEHGSSGVSITAGQWHDIILTSRQASGTTSDLRLYVDGEFRYERLGSLFDHSSPPSNLVVGMDRPNDLRDYLYLRGEVAIYTLWSRVLSDGEIAAWSRDPFVMLRPKPALMPLLFTQPAPSTVTGTVEAQESGSDAMTASGAVVAAGSMEASEGGADVLTASAAVTAAGTVEAQESAPAFNAPGGSGLYATYVSGKGDLGVTSDYNIELIFSGTWEVEWQTAVIRAAEYVSHLITVGLADHPDVNHDIEITATIEPIDGAYNAVASGGVNGVRSSGADIYLTHRGEIKIDSADVVRLNSEGTLPEIALHEVIHAIGFGTIWHFHEVTTTEGGGGARFTGTNARAAYEALYPDVFAADAYSNIGVPLGGDGNKHWSESHFGSELLTPIAGAAAGSNILSAMTVASLEDLGYQTIFDAADPGATLAQPAAVLQPSPTSADQMTATATVTAPGTMEATEGGADALTASGAVTVVGTVEATEGGADALTASGLVTGGDLIVVAPDGAIQHDAAETVLGAVSVTGGAPPYEFVALTGGVPGYVLAGEAGGDALTAAGFVGVTGAVQAVEAAGDVLTASGAIFASGSVEVLEAGGDVLTAAGFLVSGADAERIRLTGFWPGRDRIEGTWP